MNFFSWKFGQIFQRGMLFSTGVLSIWSITFMLLWHAKLHIRCLYETFMNSIFFLLEKISYIRCEDLCKIYVMSPCYLLLVVKLKISTENMCISLEIQVFWWKRAEKSWEVAFISRIGSFFCENSRSMHGDVQKQFAKIDLTQRSWCVNKAKHPQKTLFFFNFNK